MSYTRVSYAMEGLHIMFKREGLKQNAQGNAPAFSIWTAWVQMWPEWASGHHFEYLGSLAPDMAKVASAGLF